MKEYLFLGVVMTLLTLGPARADSQTIFPYQHDTRVFDNGLTVILIPMESPGLVAYYSVVRTGSRDEVEKGKSGFAHFFEHMMFRGTENFPGPVYDSIMTSIGADANAYTTDDYTAYHQNFAKEDLEKVIQLESDRFQFLQYSEADFKTEAGAVYGEYRKGITSPWWVLNEYMQNLAYDVHTYKHTTIGFERDIKAMPQQFEYAQSFFNRYYRPDNVVIVVAGDIDSVGTFALIQKYYSGWGKGYMPPAIVPEPEQKKPRNGEVKYGGKTLPIIDMAFKGDAFDPENTEYVAAMLLGDLAFGENSDLYKKLVIQEQKVQFIASGTPLNRDVPLFEIYSMVKDEKDLGYVQAEMTKTLQQFQANPVDMKKLDDLKKRNKYSFLMGLDTPDNVAGGLARFVALTGGIDVVDRLYTKMDEVTPDDIARAANKYFTPGRRTTVVLKGAK